MQSIDELKSFLAGHFGQAVAAFESLRGGDINEVYAFEVAARKYVLKRNDKVEFPLMFEKEQRGLEALIEAGLTAPQPLLTFDQGPKQHLILEYIKEERIEQNRFWQNFGAALALLHQKQGPSFGLEENNYIGSLEQINTYRDRWSDFFTESRLGPMQKMAFDQGLLTRVHLQAFDRLSKRLGEIIPEEPASLLHGDLWSGNLMCGQGQKAVFIDPAVYYGHREMDLAMTFMFGGFDSGYLGAYENVLPLAPGFHKRLEIHNLYPNLVHLNLFGASYLGGIVKVLKKF